MSDVGLQLHMRLPASLPAFTCWIAVGLTAISQKMKLADPDLTFQPSRTESILYRSTLSNESTASERFTVP